MKANFVNLEISRNRNQELDNNDYQINNGKTFKWDRTNFEGTNRLRKEDPFENFLG